MPKDKATELLIPVSLNFLLKKTLKKVDDGEELGCGGSDPSPLPLPLQPPRCRHTPDDAASA